MGGLSGGLSTVPSVVGSNPTRDTLCDSQIFLSLGALYVRLLSIFVRGLCPASTTKTAPSAGRSNFFLKHQIRTRGWM